MFGHPRRGAEPGPGTMRPKNAVRSMLKRLTTPIREIPPDESAKFPYVRPRCGVRRTISVYVRATDVRPAERILFGLFSSYACCL